MRTQPGTTSLRAIVYMDEIFGYFPPVANPPTKQPLLTLLKQARAFGVGRACWRRRTRSTSTTRGCPTPARGSSAGCRPSATRRACSTGWKAPRPRARRDVRPRGDGEDPRRARQPRVPDEQRPRGRPGRVPDALGDVVPARAADARADQDPDRQAHRRRRAGAGGVGRAAVPYRRSKRHESQPTNARSFRRTCRRSSCPFGPRRRRTRRSPTSPGCSVPRPSTSPTPRSAWTATNRSTGSRRSRTVSAPWTGMNRRPSTSRMTSWKPSRPTAAGSPRRPPRPQRPRATTPGRSR